MKPFDPEEFLFRFEVSQEQVRYNKREIAKLLQKHDEVLSEIANAPVYKCPKCANYSFSKICREKHPEEKSKRD